MFEGYYDVTDLEQSIRDTSMFLWTVMGAGFIFLYVSLFTIVRNASRTLVRQSKENKALYEEAERRIVEREEAELQTQRQVKRLKALRNIDIAISSNLDLRLTLHVILSQVCAHLHVDAAGVLLLDKQTQMFEYVAESGFRSDSISSFKIKLGDGYTGRIAQQHPAPQIVDISETDTRTGARTEGKGEFASSWTEQDRPTQSSALSPQSMSGVPSGPPGRRTQDLLSPQSSLLAKERSHILSEEGFVAYSVCALLVKGQTKGVLEIFHRSPLNPDEEWLSFFETLAGQAAIAVDNATLFDDLQSSMTELSLAYERTLEGWSQALDLRDEETQGHSLRVTDMTVRLAQKLGVSEEELVHIRRGALLHDIGKMGVPNSVLLKPGPLTDDEWKIMRQHPMYAYLLLSPITFLRPALEIPYCHHEKWDGTGYPRRLLGEEIPLSARIFAVIDVWDALGSNRPYRKALPPDTIYTYLREQSGKHFEPRIVEIFLEMVGANEPQHDPVQLVTRPLQSSTV